jgi:DnaD/phage-associated family protein
MARGRMLSAAIAEDPEFNGMSMEAQLLFLRTIPHLDRDGLINGHPSILHGKVAPLMENLASKMKEVIQEWIAADLVIHYTTGKTQVLFFKGFAKNQSLVYYDREAASQYPPPPGYYRAAKGLKPVEEKSDAADQSPPSDERPTHEEVMTKSGQTHEEVTTNRIEVEVKEKKTTTTTVEVEPIEEPKPQSKNSGGGELPLLRNRQTDTDYARLCAKFESEGFGTLTQILAEQIDALLKEHPVEWIDDAMAVAVGAGKRQLRYVNGILVKWRSEGRGEKKAATNGQMQAPKLLSLKEWCLEKYNVSKPEFVPVGAAVVHEQYNQYRNQQAH